MSGLIGPTLTMRDAMSHLWDCTVIGAGPSGAMAAGELARSGASILLIDKQAFPRGKVCGCCLNQSAQITLQSAGLENLLSDLKASPLEKIELAVAGCRASIRLPSSQALSREALDACLVRSAISKGCQFLPMVHASVRNVESEFVSLTLRDDECDLQLKSRVVVVADGLGSTALVKQPELAPIYARHSRIGAGAVADRCANAYAPGTIFMACGAGGYAGLVRLEDGRLDIAAALDRHFVQKNGGPGRAVELILEESGLPPVVDLLDLNWRGTAALTCKRRNYASRRVLVIGDAASYSEPFTGEGIAWALTSGQLVAPFVLEGISGWNDLIARRWQKAYEVSIRRRQKLSLALSTLLRRPILMQLMVQALSQLPELATPFVQEINAA